MSPAWSRSISRISPEPAVGSDVVDAPRRSRGSARDSCAQAVCRSARRSMPCTVRASPVAELGVGHLRRARTPTTANFFGRKPPFSRLKSAGISFALRQVARGAEDDQRRRGRRGAVVLRGRPRLELLRHAPGFRVLLRFRSWPPNCSRIAESTFSAKVCSCRERNRANSEAVSTSAGTASSIAACTVQRPSPESWTKPVYSSSCRVLGQRHGRQVEQPRADDAAAAPELGDVGEVEVVAVLLGQLLRTSRS